MMRAIQSLPWETQNYLCYVPTLQSHRHCQVPPATPLRYDTSRIETVALLVQAAVCVIRLVVLV